MGGGLEIFSLFRSVAGHLHGSGSLKHFGHNMHWTHLWCSWCHFLLAHFFLQFFNVLNLKTELDSADPPAVLDSSVAHV